VGVAEARAKAPVTVNSLAFAPVTDARMAARVKATAKESSRIMRGMGWFLRQFQAGVWWQLRGMASRLVVVLFLIVPAAAQETRVAIELVLALDSSASVDRTEFQLQLDGLARAFRDPEVLQALDNLRPLGVAVGVLQWGAPGETRIVLPFTHLESARDAKAFGFRISLIRRWLRASATSIGTALDDSRVLIGANEFDGDRLVIDVSGDGPDNSGVDLAAARQRARKAGIVINGLPIMADQEGLDIYYRDHVIIGPDAFIEPARDFEDYVRAIREKLLKELRPLAS
jgi:hypothetical protein